MESRRTGRWWFYVVLPAVAVATVLALVELGHALFFPVPFSVEANMYYEPDPHTGYRIRANSLGTFGGSIPAQANEHGQRDESVSLEKPENVFRVLVLGDSFTMGVHVHQHEIYTEVLEDLLGERVAGPVQVINAGVGGWEPFQYAQYFEHYGRAFSPDLVLIGFFVGNDTYDQKTSVGETRTAVLGRRVARHSAVDPLIRVKVFLYTRSHLARRILYRGPVDAGDVRSDCSDFTDQFIAIQRERVDNHRATTYELNRKAINGVEQVERIAFLAREDSIPTLVTLIPDENQINRELQNAVLGTADRLAFDFDMPQSMLRKMFFEARIPVLDLLPVFRRDRRCLYTNNTHWNAAGHELAAEAVFESLSNQRIWPTLSWQFSEAERNESGNAGQIIPSNR